MFCVVAGILPAVEPGILPGGMGRWFERALPFRAAGPGGKMPPSTAAKMAAATYYGREPHAKHYGRAFPAPMPLTFLNPPCFFHPGPRTTRPGFAPVCSPSFKT